MHLYRLLLYIRGAVRFDFELLLCALVQIASVDEMAGAERELLLLCALVQIASGDCKGHRAWHCLLLCALVQIASSAMNAP